MDFDLEVEAFHTESAVESIPRLIRLVLAPTGSGC
jgi:hypothetical protein